MSSDNHNEKFKLLGVSGSDSGSEIPEFVLPKRKVKTKKKHRPNGMTRQSPILQRRYCSLIFILKILAILSLVVTLGVTVWLSVNLHMKVDKLRNDYKQGKETLYHQYKQVKTVKKMKKRRELDALAKVPNGKVRKKSSGNGSGAELLRVDDSDTTDTEEFSVLQPRKFSNQKACLSGLRAACVPVCTLTLFVACVVGSGTLIWMQFGMRQEVDLLRDHVRQVEESGKSMPPELYGIHSQLNDLQKNHSSLKDEVDQLNKTLESITKEISALKKTSAEIQKSVADAPQLETLPKDFNALSQNLASIGSKITDLETNLKKNLDVVKSQLANNDKDKLHWEEMFADLQKKVDHVSVSQGKGADSSDVYTYIDNEVKKLEDALYETNVSIWDKLNWATEDLHEHHMTIEAAKASSQDLSTRVSKLESVGSPIDNQTLLKVNETVAALLNSFLPSSLLSLNLMSNGTVVLANLVEYVKNLTRIYVALLAHMKALPEVSIQQLNDTLIPIDLNTVVHGVVDATFTEQNSKIKELYVALESLNGTIEQLKGVKLPPSLAEVSPNKTVIAPVVSVNSATEPALATVKPAATDSPKLNSTAPPEAPPSITLENPGVAAVAVGVNSTTSPASGNVTTTPTNATVIHKPSQTGQSLNLPELRPDSPPPD